MYEYCVVNYCILKHAYLKKMILMYPYFIALVIYLLIKVCICSTLSYEVARIFFLSSSACRNFFSSSISCMNFFLDLTPPPPPPRISNGSPLSTNFFCVFSDFHCITIILPIFMAFFFKL